MPISSARRHTIRAVALLATGLLTVGLAQAPSSAGSDEDAAPRTAPGLSAPERDLGLTWSELRDLGASVHAGDSDRAAERAAPRRTAVVRDPRGDASRFGGLERPRPHTLLADLTRVTYRTASIADGDLRVGATWSRAVDASRRGVRRQYLVTFLRSPSRPRHFWAMWVGNATDRVNVFRLDDGGERRIRPARVGVERSFGAGGTTVVTVSDEWLGNRRISVGSVGISGWDGEATDETRSVRGPLVVGPAPR